MKNNSAESSASSHTPPPPDDQSPRRRSGGGSASNASPRGRGSASNTSPRGRGTPPRFSWEAHLFNLPRPPVPPVMGVPGRTAFGLYRPPAPVFQPSARSAFGPYRPPPPPPLLPFSAHSAFRPYRPPPPPPPPPPPLAPMWPGPGPMGSRGIGFLGDRSAVPVGGGNIVAAGPLRIGGSPAGRKRAREDGAGGSGGGGVNRAGDGGGRLSCSVCNKEFGSSKALFGHMRSHPGRGWKGVHPPPAFKADEEFADLRAGAGAQAEEEAAAKEAEDQAGEGTSRRRVPDLNHPPPPDAN